MTNNNQNSSRSNSQRSSRSRRNFRDRNRTPSNKRSKAQATSKPHFAKRRSINRDSGPGSKALTPKQLTKEISKGNLAHSEIDGALNKGPIIQTNSAQTFEAPGVVRIIPIGGVSEVGMNMTALEYGDDIVVVDMGMGFGGGNRFPGVDYIIPDTAWLEENRHKIRGVIFTHGHLDHIGAAPYVLPKLGPIPIFGMPLTLGLLKNRLQDFHLEDKFVAKVIDLEKPLTLGAFQFDFFRLNHSISDVVGLGINTPMGRIVYATDWKFDNTPPDGQLSDYEKLAKFGKEGTRLLLTDSLGILKPGYQKSERVIGDEVIRLIGECKNRVILTTFASTTMRAQHAIDAALKYNRKVALAGRSMINAVSLGLKLGYIKAPAGLFVDIKEVKKLPDHQVLILSTGSQGEDMAGLSRMARDEHSDIKLQAGDSVIFSSNPIPGNEDDVQNLIANLSRKGVLVYRNKDHDLHVSGHACQEDLKILFALTRPDYLQPIHGDHFMLRKVAELGAKVGIPTDHCLIGENGRIVEMRSNEVVLTDDVITESYVLVDGMSVGAVSEVVLEERRKMANDGSVIVVLLVDKRKKLLARPEIISRGFVYVKNSQDFMNQIKEAIVADFKKLNLDPKSPKYFSELRNHIKNIAGDVIYKITEKNPMVIPVVVQV